MSDYLKKCSYELPVHFSRVVVLLHNNHIVQKLNSEHVSSFEDDESMHVGVVLMLLQMYVWLSG